MRGANFKNHIFKLTITYSIDHPAKVRRREGQCRAGKCRGCAFLVVGCYRNQRYSYFTKNFLHFFSKMYNNWQPAFNYSIMYNYLVNGVNHNILLPKFTKSTHVVLSVFFKYLLFKIRKITSRYFENMPLNEIFLAKYPEIHSIFECQFHPIKIIGHSIFLASPT